MRRDTPLPMYAPVHILDDLPLHSPSCVITYNGWPISEPKNKLKHSSIVFTEI